MMTTKVERMVKKDHYRERKLMASTCLMAMGAKAGQHAPDSWEGVMTMLADVFRRSKSPEEMAVAVMSTAKWVWANEECLEEKSVRDMEQMMEEEASETADGDAPANGTGHADGAEAVVVQPRK